MGDPTHAIFRWLLRAQSTMGMYAAKSVYDNVISEGYTSIADLIMAPPARSDWAELGVPAQHLDYIVAAFERLEHASDAELVDPEDSDDDSSVFTMTDDSDEYDPDDVD
jgi:hypothetical protein